MQLWGRQPWRLRLIEPKEDAVNAKAIARLVNNLAGEFDAQEARR